MVKEPRLAVEPVEGHPGRRLLVVEYELDPETLGGPGADVHETVIVRATDLHDAPVEPSPLDIELAPVSGTGSGRRFEREVPTVDLDVEQDWWRTGLGGEVEPIAEFPDHLMGVITVRRDGRIVAEAETPTVTGSWGALGDH